MRSTSSVVVDAGRRTSRLDSPWLVLADDAEGETGCPVGHKRSWNRPYAGHTEP